MSSRPSPFRTASSWATSTWSRCTARRRRGAFVIVVQCTSASANCFCTSMGTGPRAAGGFDLALTEVTDGEGHAFVVEAGSETGAEVLGGVEGPQGRREGGPPGRGGGGSGGRPPSPAAGHRGDPRPSVPELRARAVGRRRRPVPELRQLHAGVPDLLLFHRGGLQRRGRHSAPNAGAGGTPASSRVSLTFTAAACGCPPSSRYRQWLTHKLAAWIDQFGTSGCVGCGRCITWCPVGIDITEEVAAIRGGSSRRRRRTSQCGKKSMK